MSAQLFIQVFLSFFRKSKYIQSKIIEMRKWKNFILIILDLFLIFSQLYRNLKRK